MQAVQLEREQNNLKEAFALCQEALDKYPEFPKLWMISAQIKEQLSADHEEAAVMYIKGVSINL
jgi:pre-mRNA-processing factor 6